MLLLAISTDIILGIISNFFSSERCNWKTPGGAEWDPK